MSIDLSAVLACTTCNESLRAQIFDGTFLFHTLRILVPTLGGGLVLATLVRTLFGRGRNAMPAAASIAAAGTLLGLGLGGFVDGILLHHLLQWHQMFSNEIPPVDLLSKSVNMFWDGMFQIAALTLTLLGVLALWRLPDRNGVRRPAGLLFGAMIFGWGAFNFVDSLFNHYIFRYHNVREPPADPQLWNLGFLLLSIALLLFGWSLMKRTSRRPEPPSSDGPMPLMTTPPGEDFAPRPGNETK